LAAPEPSEAAPGKSVSKKNAIGQFELYIFGSHPKKLVNNKGCFDLTLLDLTL